MEWLASEHGAKLYFEQHPAQEGTWSKGDNTNEFIGHMTSGGKKSTLQLLSGQVPTVLRVICESETLTIPQAPKNIEDQVIASPSCFVGAFLSLSLRQSWQRYQRSMYRQVYYCPVKYPTRLRYPMARQAYI